MIVSFGLYVKYDFHYVGHDWKNHCQRLPQGSPQWASQFDTHSCLTQSVTLAVHNEQFN